MRTEQTSSSKQLTLFKERTGFHYACEEGRTEIVNLLLARDDLDVTAKDDVSQQNPTLSLCLTTNIGSENRTNHHLYQAITLFQGMTGFHWACGNGHTEIVNLLLARDDVDINTKGDVSPHHSDIISQST